MSPSNGYLHKVLVWSQIKIGLEVLVPVERDAQNLKGFSIGIIFG
jgi:hypothetical protein